MPSRFAQHADRRVRARSYASGGDGTSRVPRIAGDVTAGSAPFPVSYASCAERRRLYLLWRG